MPRIKTWPSELGKFYPHSNSLSISKAALRYAYRLQGMRET